MSNKNKQNVIQNDLSRNDNEWRLARNKEVSAKIYTSVASLLSVLLILLSFCSLQNALDKCKQL